MDPLNLIRLIPAQERNVIGVTALIRAVTLADYLVAEFLKA